MTLSEIMPQMMIAAVAIFIVIALVMYVRYQSVNIVAPLIIGVVGLVSLTTMVGINESVNPVVSIPTPVPPTPEPTATPIPPTTLVLSPIVSGDDGFENRSDEIINIASLTNYMSTTSVTAIRFQNVDVPQGQVISSADLTLWSSNDSGQNGRVYGFDRDDQPGILTDIISETWTTNYTLWTFGNVNLDVAFTSPDLATVIQEIIDLPGWISGNSLVLVLEGYVGDTKTSRSWNYGNRSRDPVLEIVFQP